jgi:hypothetical protein
MYLIELQISEVQLCRNILKIFRDSDSARITASLRLCCTVLFNLTSMAKEDKKFKDHKMPGVKSDVRKTGII